MAQAQPTRVVSLLLFTLETTIYTGKRRDKQGVTVVGKHMAMSPGDSPPDRSPDSPPLNFPVNEMTSRSRASVSLIKSKDR